jgi:hypothetical protein
MQYRAFEPGIEVNGRTVYAVVDGFKTFRRVAKRFLADEGIGEVAPSGDYQIDMDGWYPQQSWLRAFERIGADVGEAVLYDIGMSIPANAEFPPWVVDVETAIKSIDIAYHMNHRKHGRAMFDVASGRMLEGIGHYGFERVEGKNEIVSICRNPYPCSFDHGIVTSMARRFAPSALVDHDPVRPCRRLGDDSCTYRVRWRD